MRVALATCKRLPEPDPDEPAVLEALARAGIEASVLAWDDDGARFADQDLVVVRSTWNYYEDVDGFVAWAERTARATRLLNGPEVIAWNTRKTYLRELEARGVAIVPTELAPQGARTDLAAVVDARGWERFVVKPVVSAGSFRTERFARPEIAAAQRFLDDLVQDRSAMVQAWMPAVDGYGERSMIFVDGALTHAIRKEPRFAGGAERVSVSGVAALPDERAFAEGVLAKAGFGGLLYARVDTIRDEETLRLMELELVEPSLFFVQSPVALGCFVDAVARIARSA